MCTHSMFITGTHLRPKALKGSCEWEKKWEQEAHQRVIYTVRKSSELMAQRELCNMGEIQESQSEDAGSITSIFYLGYKQYSAHHCVRETTTDGPHELKWYSLREKRGG